MSITVKMRGKKWLLEIKDEVWVFEDKEQIKKVCNEMIEMKETYGNIGKGDY